MKKKYLSALASVLCSAALAVSLSGCGSGASNSEGNNAPAEQEQTQVTADQVESNLQGSWNAADGLSITTFNGGNFTMESTEGGPTFEGTYEIDTEGSTVKCTIVASDGNLAVTFPYKMDGDAFKLYKKDGSEMTKA